MKPTSPAELYSEQDTFTTSANLEEDLQTRSPSSCGRTTALLDEINSLAQTNSVAETLELTARLLTEVEIAVTHLSLDRGGFVTVWKPPQANTVGCLDPRRRSAIIQSSSDPARAGATFRQAVRTSEERGWRVFYLGAPMRG